MATSRGKVKSDELIADGVQHRHRESIKAFEQLQMFERLLKKLPDLDNEGRAIVEAEIKTARTLHDRAVDALVAAILTARAVTSSRSRGGQNTTQLRRDAARKLLLDIEQIRTNRPNLSEAAAARVYLETHDQTWHAGVDEERSRKIDALLRRIRRARREKPRTSAAANVRSIH